MSENKKEAIKLLPCPCCGGKGRMFMREKFFTFHAVICEECGLRTQDYPLPEQAAEKWNTRKPIESLVERLESSKGNCSMSTCESVLDEVRGWQQS